MTDMKNLYGPAPERFVLRVSHTVQTLSCEEAQHRAHPRLPRRRLALAVCLMLLVSATAYATARFGLLDRLHPYIQAHLQDDAGTLVQTDIPQQGGQLDLATYTAEEALWDGHQAYVTVRISPADAEKILLMDGQSFPSDSYAWQETGDRVQGETFSKRAADSGRTLISATLWTQNAVSYRNVRYDGEDILYTLAFACDAPESVTLNLCTIDVYGEGENTRQWGELTFSLTPTDVRQTVQLSAPVKLPLLGATLRICRVEKTPIAAYLTVAYEMNEDATDQQRVLTQQGIFVKWIDEDGSERTDCGGGGIQPWGEEGCIQTRIYAVDALPDAITLAFAGGMYRGDYDIVTVPLTPLSTIDAQTEE